MEDRYDQTNGAKLYQIQREINELSQGTLDVTAYYTKMKKLWEELSTLHIKFNAVVTALVEPRIVCIKWSRIED